MNILAITSVRNEAPYLIEWIAWHRMIGVTDFVISSNDCEDGSDRMLELLQSAGVVQHIPQGDLLSQPSVEGKSIQWQALRHGWRHPLRKQADWVLISDMDEFPVIHAGAGNFQDLFAAVDMGATDAIAIPWRLFGFGGVQQILDAPVTAQFRRSAPPDLRHPVAATFFKSLFRPKMFKGPGVHRPAQRDTVPAWRDGSGHALPPLHATNDRRLSLMGLGDTRSLIEMHHYSLRSIEAFLVKTLRGLPNRKSKAIDLAYWVERNFNTVPNEAALSQQARLADAMAELLAIPGLASLHGKGRAWHHDAANTLVRTRAGYEMYRTLQHMTNSAVLSEPMTRHLLQMYAHVTD